MRWAIASAALMVLMLAGLPGVAVAETVEYQVSASADDTQATQTTNSATLTTMRWPYSNDSIRSFARWQINIPVGATIQSAYVKVCSNSSTTSERAVQLQLLDSDSCSDFSTNPYAWATTGSTVNWSLGTWATGTWYTSPDIAAIVQAFVDRAGYAPGHYLGLCGSWQSGTAVTSARTWDFSGSTYGARLEITYTAGTANEPPTADAGSNQQVVDSGGDGHEIVTLDGSASSDSDGTIVSYVWTESGTTIATGSSPQVDLGIGEHTITLTVADDDGATDDAAVQVTVSAQQATTTIEYQVSASVDDTQASEASNSPTLSTMRWPYSNDSIRSFARWQIDIPAGATIQSAYVKVCANSSTTSERSVRLQLVDADSCADFSTNPYGWATTGSTVDWSLGTWSSGTWYTSPDVTAMVQAFVDRAGYAPGSYLGLCGSWASGTAVTSARTWDFSGNVNGAKLEVTYSVGAANEPPTADAGSDQQVADSGGDGYETVTLDGSSSSDADGTIVSYVWTEGGSAIATGDTAEVVLGVGTHTILLTVTDDDGATAEDAVVVTVSLQGILTVDAGDDQTVTDLHDSGYAVVRLGGAASRDPAEITSYVWYEGATQIATGNWPTVCPTVGAHTFTLVVTDIDSQTAQDAVTVVVNPYDSDTCPPLTIPIYTPQNAPATPTLEELPLVSSVTYCDVTWTFSSPVRVGRFVTGDYYVVGPVTITGITPAWDGVKNGSVLNLPVTGVLARSQTGFDTRARGGRYQASLTVVPPISMVAGDILISSICMADGETPIEPFGGGTQSGSPVKSVSVLHCLSAPVPPDAFRPGYTDRTQTIYLSRNLDRSLLPTVNYGQTAYVWPMRHGIFEGLSTTTIHTWAWLYERPWIDICWFNYDSPLAYMPGYGHLIARAESMASLILATNEAPADKEKLLIGFLQYGIDLWGAARGGFVGWPGFGGLQSGRKWPIVMAGVLLGDEDMASPTVSYPNCLFGEDTQTLYGDGWTGTTVVFGGHQYGKGLDYWLDPPPTETKDAGPYEHKDPTTWNSWNYQSESYRRCCTASGWVGYALVVQLMGAEAAWDNDAFFVYCDRWMYEDNAATAAVLQEALELNPDPYFHDDFSIPANWLLPSSKHASEQFVQDMWNMFRTTLSRPTDQWME
ncbi:MAG TPA: PKD domain-containing protein [Phycisphaerae bacterium]|nr:hypothetical protein [Phycisphaerae bacterium]HOI53926.1 PKD domain-containing protein [Phycisphaerae bacterium]